MADQPPPNYNPNDSMLNGGNDNVIMKVMGGGGTIGGGDGTAPNGYNETQSLLSGGIDTPIIKVEGGGPQEEALEKARRNSYERGQKKEESERKDTPTNMDSLAEELDQTRRQNSNTPTNMASLAEKLDQTRRNEANKKREKREERKWERRGKTNIVPNISSLYNEPSSEIKEDIKQTNLENIRIIKSYDKADQDEYKKFIGKINNKLDSAISKLENQIVVLRKLHYILDQRRIEVSSINTKNLQGYEAVRFIPLNTKTIIVLPPVEKDPKVFFNMILFLKQNNYLSIKSGEFLLKRNIFVIHCSIDRNVKLNNYFYLKLKKNNNNYEIMNDEYENPQNKKPINEKNPYKIVYPKAVDRSKALLFSNIPLNKSSGLNDVLPTNFDIINENNISLMYYKKSDSTFNNEFSVISGGNNDTETPTNYNITLNKYIAIIDLVDEDVYTVNVDINGNLYRIRVPYIKDPSDKVYASWQKNRFTDDEQRLLDDLYVNEIDNLRSPLAKADILFQLSYFKCFNDISLLTKSECLSMRENLETIYKHVLQKDNIPIN